MSSNEKEQEPILWWHPPVLLSFLPLQIQRPDWILVMLLYKHFETNCETLDLYPPAHRHTQFLLVWYRTNHQEHHLTMFQIHKKKDTNYFLVQKLRTWNSFKKAQIYIPFTLILIQIVVWFVIASLFLYEYKVPEITKNSLTSFFLLICHIYPWEHCASGGSWRVRIRTWMVQWCLTFDSKQEKVSVTKLSFDSTE